MSALPYDFIVLTAAITRPDLHSQVIPGHFRFIGPARVKWLINVDDVGSGHSVDDTVHNIRHLLAAPNIDVEFLCAPGPGCFFQAARRLALRAGELLASCRTGVVWLEDDWQLATRSRIEQLLNRLRLGVARERKGADLRCCLGNLQNKQAALEALRPPPLWFVSLVPRARVSFNPGIWSKPLFERGMLRPLQRQPPDQVNDPETLCADPWNNVDSRRELALFMDPLFEDAGRQWSAARGLTKWEKAPTDLAQRGTVTYVGVSATKHTADSAVLDRLTGWVKIPGRAFGTGLPVVGRIAVRDRRLTANLTAVPSFKLELFPSGEDFADVYLHRMHRWSRTYPFKKMNARVVWRNHGEPRIEVQTRRGAFAVALRRSMPASALWMAPLQATVGSIGYAASLICRLLRLDADSSSR